MANAKQTTKPKIPTVYKFVLLLFPIVLACVLFVVAINQPWKLPLYGEVLGETRTYTERVQGGKLVTYTYFEGSGVQSPRNKNAQQAYKITAVLIVLVSLWFIFGLFFHSWAWRLFAIAIFLPAAGAVLFILALSVFTVSF
jgi:hypothetical protein